jgi:hypothetical protein
MHARAAPLPPPCAGQQGSQGASCHNMPPSRPHSVEGCPWCHLTQPTAALVDLTVFQVLWVLSMQLSLRVLLWRCMIVCLSATQQPSLHALCCHCCTVELGHVLWSQCLGLPRRPSGDHPWGYWGPRVDKAMRHLGVCSPSM